MKTDAEKDKGSFIEQPRKNSHTGKVYHKRNKTQVGQKIHPPNEEVRIFLVKAEECSGPMHVLLWEAYRNICV